MISQGLIHDLIAAVGGMAEGLQQVFFRTTAADEICGGDVSRRDQGDTPNYVQAAESEVTRSTRR